MFEIDIQELVRVLLARVIEGGAIVLAIYILGRKSLDLREMVYMALVIAAVMTVTSIFAPGSHSGIYDGMGIGMGVQAVGATANPAMFA